MKVTRTMWFDTCCVPHAVTDTIISILFGWWICACPRSCPRFFMTVWGPCAPRSPCFPPSMNHSEKPQLLCNFKQIPSYAIDLFFPPQVQVQIDLHTKCIPVGCVPSAAVAMSIPACTGRGVSAWGVSTRGCLPGGCITSCTEADTPPREQNSWHTLVKILPCHNFISDGFRFRTGSCVGVSVRDFRFGIWQKVASQKRTCRYF